MLHASKGVVISCDLGSDISVLSLSVVLGRERGDRIDLVLRRDPAARDELTAQELQIAQLAAQGLSNREVGQRLYVSHRTVGTHLYRVFPKLGITGRGELGSALSADPAVQERQGHGALPSL